MPSISKSQQRLMGAALAHKRGKNPKAPKAVKDVAKSMTEEQLKDFASTRHKGLPKKASQAEKTELVARLLGW